MGLDTNQTRAGITAMAAATGSVTARAFRILEAFNAARREITLSELARRTELPVSTTHRLVADLHNTNSARSVPIGDRPRISPVREFGQPHMNLMNILVEMLLMNTMRVDT